MFAKALKVAAITAVLSGFFAPVLAEASESGPFMATNGTTTRPIGHHNFCKRNWAECRVRSRTEARVQLTQARWDALVAINIEINRAILPVTDAQLFGREEFWDYPESMGDCEDFVLLKRRELIAMGWPVGSLLITVVRQKNGDGHAVLTVLTDRGDLVLDNLESDVKIWSDTDYRYVKRQSEFDTGRWLAISDIRTPTVGSLSR